MKKRNYYSIHLNKKPKRKKIRRYFSTLGIRLAMHQVQIAQQTAIIQSQPFKEYKDKAKALINLIETSCKEIIQIAKDETQRRFLITGKYTKQK